MDKSIGNKKKLAVFSGGWSGEYLSEVLAGIIENADESNFDVFTFINFSINANVPAVNDVEVNFFRLPDLNDFDGVILLTNSFNQQAEIDYLSSEVKRVGIPAISLELELPGIPTIFTDNFSGMYALTEHLIKDHNAKRLVYIGGPKTHPENQVRLSAFRAAISDNNLSFSDEDLIYSNWGNDIIPEQIDNWMEKSGSLPDAFVCANDIMAIAVCNKLKNMNYSIPEDTLVTGYDCITLAQNYDPVLTSVNHQWFPMGQAAFASVVNLINHIDVPESQYLPTKLIIGESCGCKESRSISRRKQYLKRALTRNIMDPTLVDSHFRHFISSIRKVSTKEELHSAFSHLFRTTHVIEGENFGLYLYPEFFTENPEECQITPDNQPNILEVCGLRDGQPTEMTLCDLRHAIFSCSEKTDKTGYYLFLPLHNEHRTYGCAMLTGALNAASENQYYIWTMHMIQALEQVESYMTIDLLYKKMEKLSVTDPLTEVYNRAGCEKISYPILIDWGKQGGSSVVLLADVDHMKWINDRYGHCCGDIALKIFAKVLKETLPEDFIISRFGGDEFFVAGKLETGNENIDALINRIEKNIVRESVAQNIDFSLTASIGYAITSPKDVADIEHAVVHADKDMYRRKAVHHDKVAPN